ncbi:hypothetical protein NDK47_00900 [Brevibacillus ruminantium]|uniref:Hint domain-containing protein n=1 Tax=Brevibacillus ruminantium TaxID=2950604 RepID=A0ABY4WFU6_9BACL|nr:hypothetical protein [Brevibacillus ruminantium]USG65947.1 hypothetical protein NDK47_00900 [Brevibacillus ruminantium]
MKTSYARGAHCSKFKKEEMMDRPVLTYDDTVGECYCCCSCFAHDTPIEATPGEYVQIQNILSGDTILAAGRDLQWKPTKVKQRTGFQELHMVPGMYFVNYVLHGETEERHLIVTPDHLFLMHADRTLKRVQHLIPGDKLMGSDGNAAVVQFVTVGEYLTAIQSIEMDAPYTHDNNLEGHLLNANGVVTADYAIQVQSETSLISDELHYAFDGATEIYDAGTPEYLAAFPVDALNAFLEDETRWPKGFRPKNRKLINIPRLAHGFLSKKQAQDVKHYGEFHPYNVYAGRHSLEYLFRLNRLLCPDVICLLDWNNEEPNAYAWSENSQKYILFTGGLARLKNLYFEGLSLILATLQAYHQGKHCVGEADYQAIENLRDTWHDPILAPLVPKAIKQVKALFDLVQEQHAEGNPAKVCEQPSLECRIETYRASFSFLDLPACATPKNPFMRLEKAYANIKNTEVTVLFSEAIDPATVGAITNYQFTPEVEVLEAALAEANPKQVLLKVEGLLGQSLYILSVKNIKSIYDVPVSAGSDAVIVRTP